MFCRASSPLSSLHCDTLSVVLAGDRRSLVLLLHMTHLALSDVHNGIRQSARRRISHPFCARVVWPRTPLTQAQRSPTSECAQSSPAFRAESGGQGKLLLSRRGTLAAAAAALAVPAFTLRVAAADAGELTITREQRIELHVFSAPCKPAYAKDAVAHRCRRPAGVSQYTAGLQNRAASCLEPDQ